MKRKTAALLAVTVMAAALTACSSDTDSSSSNTGTSADVASYNLQQDMQDMTTNLSKNHDATGVDVETLDDFFSTLASSRYRLSGTVSNYTVNEYTEGYKIATATITSGDQKYMISLDSTDETLTDGEYIEVEGSLGTTISADTTNGYGAFTLSDCTIIRHNEEETE